MASNGLIFRFFINLFWFVLYVGPESIRISFHNGQFNRTSLQDHNKQLVVLLFQLQEIFDKMIGSIVKATRDSPGIALISNLASLKQSQNIDQAAYMESILKSGYSYDSYFSSFLFLFFFHSYQLLFFDIELSNFFEMSQKRSHDLVLQVCVIFLWNYIILFWILIKPFYTIVVEPSN